MSSIDTNVEWKVEGANWTQVITDSIYCLPIEIATRVIENTHDLKKAFNTSNNEYVLGLGIILMVSHNKMTSPDEIFVCHTPTVLANAGFHMESELLQNMIDKLLKH
jgi:hypothetical protein